MRVTLLHRSVVIGLLLGYIAFCVDLSLIFAESSSTSASESIDPSGYYVLDRFGGVHAGGNAPVLSPPTPYWGFDVAQDLELAATGYYVLDRFGGVHAGGGAAPLSPATPYWGFDVAQDLELASVGYYVLDRFGGVHFGGGAPTLSPLTPYWGFNVAQDMELAPTGHYTLDRFGGVHVGGGASALSPPTPYWGFDVAQDIELASTGYYVLDRFGGVHAGGGAPVRSPPTPYWGFDVAQSLELAITGYYVLDRFGGIHTGGGAHVLSPATPYWGFNVAQDLELTSDGVDPVTSFGPGQHLVGTQIEAGRYYSDPVDGCYWERQSGLGGTFEEIIANDFVGFDSQQSIVDIAATDVAFETDADCGTWFSTPRHGPRVDIPPGTWLVGAQISPGTYSAVVSSGCYWERLRDFSGEFGGIISNKFIDAAGQQFVSIEAGDTGFYADEDCGTWTQVTTAAGASPDG